MGVQSAFVDLDVDDARWDAALPVLQELRPSLSDAEFAVVRVEGSSQGLRFTAAFVDGRCVAVAGWRVLTTTSAGRKLYIDDLATAAAERSRGHGAALFAELSRRGVGLGCNTIELDSGVQRHAAHRFYLRERMDITAHHFERRLR